MTDATSLDRATAAHQSRWGPPDFVARAPGRVNLIGEHTDYNDGFTMPMALPFDTVFAFSNNDDPSDQSVTISSEGFGTVTFHPGDHPSKVEPWAIHVVGVANLLAEQGIDSGSWRAAVATDIPTGASLSSSAAIEVAAITALLHRAGTTWTAIDIAKLGRRVENEVLGLPSGIMDQFISAGAVAGYASLMDCRALTLTPSPLPDDAVVAVMDSGTRRVLAEGAYGDRQAACRRAAAAIGVTALRDATLADLDKIGDPLDRRRAEHVVSEIQRTLEAAEAMTAGDSAELGRLMAASHVSLRDYYEVSGPGLNAIVDAATEASGCLGARMTGGGFAGCAVALVRPEQADDFAAEVISRYDFEGLTAKVWICRPSAGASVVSG